MLCMVVTFAVFLIAARRIAPLYSKPFAARAASGLLVVSAFLWRFSSDIGDFAAIASIVCAGIGSAASILLWAELQSCFTPFRVVLYVSGSILGGALLGWVIAGLEGERMMFALVVLPLLSLLSLKEGFSRISSADLPRRTWGKVHFPWGLIVVLGIYQFIFGMRGDAQISSVDSAVWGAVLASSALFFGTYLFSHKFDFTFVYRTPFALMACGLLIALPSFFQNGTLGALCISMAYVFMFLIITILLCDISHRYGISVLVLCGAQELTMVTIVGGDVAKRVLDVGIGGSHEWMATAIMAVLAAVATVMLFSERRLSDNWGSHFFGVDGFSEEGDKRTVLVSRCSDIADKCGLSPREKEVFWLIVSGRSPQEIEKELCIANGTLKSHTRRIYQKVDVHSRRELLELVGAMDG